jgi:hypothetical protein
VALYAGRVNLFVEKAAGFMAMFKELQASGDYLSVEKSALRGRSLAAEKNCYE